MNYEVHIPPLRELRKTARRMLYTEVVRFDAFYPEFAGLVSDVPDCQDRAVPICEVPIRYLFTRSMLIRPRAHDALQRAVKWAARGLPPNSTLWAEGDGPFTVRESSEDRVDRMLDYARRRSASKSAGEERPVLAESNPILPFYVMEQSDAPD